MANFDSTMVSVGSNTKYIISTSGRQSKILQLDIAYIPISSNISGTSKIDPKCFSYALRGMPCIGGAISKDIKHSIIPYCDKVDDFAARIGSVNTVIVKNGLLIGYNTDYVGFKEAITGGINKSGINVKTAVCYGYGGVASVVTTALADLNIQVYLIGRNNDLAKSRAIELGVNYWENQSCDLFVNATPASEQPLELANNFLISIKNCSLAFDHEMPGQYMADYCHSNNIYLIKGTDMYYPQMYAQWSLFLEGIVPIETIPDLITQSESSDV